MSDRIETVIAEAQNDHRGRVDCVGPDAWEAVCTCGWTSAYFYDEESGDAAQFAHDAHASAEILAALKAARIAAVELADEVTMEDYGLSVTPIHGSVFGLPIAEEIPDETGMTRTRWRSVSETRNYAAALLAAADAAEANHE